MKNVTLELPINLSVYYSNVKIYKYKNIFICMPMIANDANDCQYLSSHDMMIFTSMK